jgi:hypothetical protein
MSRRGGIIQFQVGGVLMDAKGDFDFGLGTPKRDAVVGSDTVHGFKETPQVPFIAGKVTDRAGLDVKALFTAEDISVTLTQANGKVVVLRNAWYAGEGTGNTGEAELDVRFEGLSAEEVA